jgi:superfamily II DNA or RNA helicase
MKPRYGFKKPGTKVITTKPGKKKTDSIDPQDWFTSEYIAQVCAASYLGKKGYTIPKCVLVPEDLAFLVKDLFVKPVIQGPQYGADATAATDAFPVYRDNAKKIYIPRFYGIERYGVPPKSEIGEGDPIDVTFAKPLRDYQDRIIDVYMKHVEKPDSSSAGAILEVPCGRGKTVMALKIIALLAKKTLIIVHKEFLLNQWVERITEFLPGATVGRIQGPIFDVAGRDIVIGMLQTMYDRDFGENTEALGSFGLTIVDEVHRIGSEQFSKTLLRLSTPYMLGVSATVDRKDQLTRVLYMFIGPKIYTESREDNDPVCVRGIEYVSSDPAFNEVEHDYRGNPKYSTMITKLCEFGPRSDFIVRILGDLVLETDDSQIMVLCHNRSLLKYLYEAIVHRGFATVGYYVGGMKQTALQTTESKRIVLATYAMAAEALDIKTLSILVMVTPKTDIVQSVGRILRVKHANPIVVDLIDKHDLFQNQWRQRKRFYRKCNYRIMMTDSLRYRASRPIDDTDVWKEVYRPSTQVQEQVSDEEVCVPRNHCFITLDDLEL